LMPWYVHVYQWYVYVLEYHGTNDT
jgi:hypothetical protein